MQLTRRFLSLCPAIVLAVFMVVQSGIAAETPARFQPVKALSDPRLAEIARQFSKTNRASSATSSLFAYSRALRIDPVTPWPWSVRKDRALLRDAMRTILTGYASPEQLEVSGPISKNSESTFRRLDSMLLPVWSEKSRDSFVPRVASMLRDTDDSVRLFEGSESNSFGHGSFVIIVDMANREILVLGIQYAE
jgi:hypothetical protein